MNLQTLIQGMPSGLEIVVIGGIAVQRYVPTYATNDLDICYHQSDTNWALVVDWLKPFQPRLWINQQELPLTWDATTPMQPYTLMTDAGKVDLLVEVDGLGRFAEVEKAALMVSLFGKDVLVLGRAGLVVAKRAANRPKDRLVLEQLERLQQD